MNTIPLTEIGAEKLRAELHEMKTVQRPAVIAAIAEARSHGDLSEMPNMTLQKRSKGLSRDVFLTLKVNFLMRRSSIQHILMPMVLVYSALRLNLKNIANETIVTYQIVGDDEADIKQGKISISSPISRALIGKHQGDIAEVIAPGGTREYKILNVRYI